MTKFQALPNAFRQSFTFVNKDVTKWFPGHMSSGLKAMQRKLKNVHCIIEVHDARIPFSGRNHNFYSLLTAIRPHILVLNKEDLADLSNVEQLVNKVKEQRGINHVIFTNCKDHNNKGLREILPKALELIKSSESYHNNLLAQTAEHLLMIIGIPNVGKSSLINQLRGLYLKKAKATRVGATPGVTTSVLERIKMNEEPPVYMLDTPGVMAPNMRSVEIGMKLAACAIVKDHLVGEDIIADYILYWLNKTGNTDYVHYLGLKEPTDNIIELLLQTAINHRMTQRVKTVDAKRVLRPNFRAAASHIIRSFREGRFGPVNLDFDLLDK